MTNRIWQIRFPLFTFLVLICIWEMVDRVGLINTNLIPPPTKIWIAFQEWVLSGEFARDSYASFGRVSIGLVLGVMTGVILGLLTGRISVIDQIFSPVLNLARAFPPVALLPVFITFFGIGNVSKITAIAFASVFPVWINTHIGSKGVPIEYLNSARLMTRSKLRIFIRIIFPAALPWIIAGIRLAIAVSFIMLYVAELAGASSGLGYQISSAHLSYRFDKMFAALFFLGFIAAASDISFNYLTKQVFPWLKCN
ncbi:MAG: ABC transporter permease [Saprospiraceae bacterium]